MDFALVLLLGLASGTVGGLVGFGSSIMLMPALVLVFGPREAVPIMAISAIMGNTSRVAAWWREVDWRAAAAYSITGIPGAALGASTLLSLRPGAVEIVMALFFLAMIPLRRWMAGRNWKLGLLHLAVAGGVALIQHAPLGLITLAVQAICGLMLPSTTIIVLLLCNDRAIMGPWVNPRWLNAIAITMITILVALSVTMMMSTLFASVNIVAMLKILAVVVAVGLAV